jgi:diguanylate cyclase (GGDEF)-like protein
LKQHDGLEIQDVKKINTNNEYGQSNSIIVWLVISISYIVLIIYSIDRLINQRYDFIILYGGILVIWTIVLALKLKGTLTNETVVQVFYYLSFICVIYRQFAEININDIMSTLLFTISDCILFISFIIALGVIVNTKKHIIAIAVPVIYYMVLLVILPKTHDVILYMLQCIVVIVICGASTSVWKKHYNSYIEGNNYTLETLRKEIRITKRTDPQTGIYNKKAILDQAKKLKDGNVPFSFIMLDIDNFKRINDTHGHVIGDKCIERLIQIVKQNCDDKVYLGRYGGDEFIVVKPIGKESIAGFLRKIITDIEADNFYGMTVSAGESKCCDNDETVEMVMYQADEALYYTKAHGKNSFNLYEDIASTRK